MRRTKYPTRIDQNGFLVLTASGHDIWMRENNPDGWTNEEWAAFATRCSSDPRFKQRCQAAKRNGRPRPHPTEGGWKAPDVGPLEAIMLSTKLGYGSGR